MWLIVCSFGALVGSAICSLYRFETYVQPLWTIGLVFALLWGFQAWWKVRRTDWFDIGCVIGLYALALFLRVGFDLRGLPAFVDKDELHLLFESKNLTTGIHHLLDIFWVGIPIFGLFPQALTFQFMEPNVLSSRIGEAIFGALAVVGVYDLGRSLANRRVGIAAAFLVAVAHESIHWARVGMPFILVSTFAALAMAFAVRAIKGGSHLSWVGASIATGFGMISYQAGYFLPVLLYASSFPFFIGTTKVSNRLRALGIYLFIGIFAALIAAPPLIKILTTVSWDNSRPAALLISREKLPELANAYDIPPTPEFRVVAHHAAKSVTVLWDGVDAWSIYGAQYPLVDPFVGAALFLLPIALLFGNRVVSWISLTWIVSYLVLGVLLVATSPTYHRISTVVIFAALAAATIVDWISPRRFKPIALTAFCVASAYCNLNYYFNEYPKKRLPELSSVIARIMSEYKNTHQIVDASHAGIITPEAKTEGALVYHAALLQNELPGVAIIELLNKGDTWTLGGTQATKVLLVTRSETLSEIGVHPPAGYSVRKTWEDTSAKVPLPVRLTMVELVKEPR